MNKHPNRSFRKEEERCYHCNKEASPQPQSKGNMAVTVEHGVPKAEMSGVNNEDVE